MIIHISQSALTTAIKKINAEYPLIIPSNNGNQYYLKYYPVNEWEDKSDFYSPIRTAQPLKSFFYPPKEKVVRYPDAKNKTQDFQAKVIIAPKACDIHALRIIDKVYLEGDYPDPG